MKNLLLTIIVLIFLSSCAKDKWVCKEGTQKITLTFDEENEKLNSNGKMLMNVVLEKVSLEDLRISGAIITDTISNHKLKIFIAPTNKDFKRSISQLTILFSSKDGGRIYQVLNIPIKK
ncbi:hypothetical protein [Flavobacterium flavigenum]|uniref:hypothetical protein n=1 Tax=Flavobacterium flavigenum TaxID=3003258 RepID=UPI0022ABDE3C|nr:hypothetical protein [Flavobacterium flavigenum]